MNIAKVTEIIAWGYKSAGLLNEDGFKIPLHCADHTLEQCLVITEKELLAETEDQ